MAPIDPKQILEAFEPVCSKTGGIISNKEVPKLSGLIKKYSKKLVSKCTYLNILLSTEESVLEEFLKCDGWQTLFTWFVDAIEKNNQAFLLELMKVLDKCPVTLGRLRENEMPKLLKELILGENQELAINAKQLRTKWREIANKSDCGESTMRSSAEKRKLKDASNRENGQLANNSSQKKLKADENAIPKPALSNSVTEKTTNADNQNGLKTVKGVPCKLGKSRSIGVLDNDVKSANHHSPAGSNSFSKGSLLINHTASTPSMPLNKLTRTNDKGIQLIDAQPLPTTELNNSSNHSTKHIIKESAGFMDALSSVPTSSTKMKKKKKVSTEKSSDKSIINSNNKSADNDIQSQDMDLDSNSSGFAPLVSNDAHRSPNDNSMDHSSNISTNENEFLTFSNPNPFDPNKLPSKGILMYVSRGNKRKISWPDEDRMERVKFFELDDKERCNVTRSNFNLHRKEEMEKERDQLHSARNKLKYLSNNPGTQLMEWRCIPIDLSEATVYSRSGSNSEEKALQEKRLNGVLEEIDLPGRPEFPREPETEPLNTLDDAQSMIIPLEDENNCIADYSHQTFQIVNEHQTSPYSLDNAYYPNCQMNVTSQQQSPSSQYYMNNVNQLLNNQTIYNPSPQLYNPVQQIMSQIPTEQSNHQWTPPMNWETTNLPPNHQNDYYNRNRNTNGKSNNFKGKNGGKKQTAVCKYWIKSGKCRHGSNCHFLHSSK